MSLVTTAKKEEGISLAIFGVLTRHAFRTPTPYLKKRFAFLERLLLFIAFQDASYVEKLHIRINLWSDEEIMAWKTSLMSLCNSVSVAATVFAGIGVTSLQLPNMDQTHWTTRAFLSSSMMVGVLSVICATNLQRNVIMCNTALEVRFWLSSGRHKEDLKAKYAHLDHFSTLPLEGSVSAALICELPAQLLQFAVLLYFTGFGIYLLFCWINQVEKESPNASRNVFIFFVVTIGLFSLQMVCGHTMRDLDKSRRMTNHSGSGKHKYLFCVEESQNLKRLVYKLDELDGSQVACEDTDADRVKGKIEV